MEDALSKSPEAKAFFSISSFRIYIFISSEIFPHRRLNS
jgi:hypothetical protein